MQLFKPFSTFPTHMLCNVIMLGFLKTELNKQD